MVQYQECIQCIYYLHYGILPFHCCMSFESFFQVFRMKHEISEENKISASKATHLYNLCVATRTYTISRKTVENTNVCGG